MDSTKSSNVICADNGIKVKYTDIHRKVRGTWKGKKIEIIRKKYINRVEGYDIVCDDMCGTVPAYRLQKVVPNLLRKFEQWNSGVYPFPVRKESNSWLKIKIPRKCIFKTNGKTTLRISFQVN